MTREVLSVWIGQYGYWGIFSCLVLGIVGLPIPDEFLLFLAGYLVFKNILSFGPTLSVAVLGTMCGILASYGLGRMSGLFLGRFKKTEQSLAYVRNFLARFGRWALVFGYLVPGVRNLTGFTAGASRMQFRTFVPYALMGALSSSAICVSVGYVFGVQAEWVFASVGRVIVFALAGIGGFFVFRRWRTQATFH
jgi:membrane protein DedA with SNARE-associated domain